MTYKKLFFALGSLASSVSGCVYEDPNCQMVEKVISNFNFRSCEESLDDRVLKEFELIAKIKDYSGDAFGLGDTPNYKEYKDGKYNPEETYYILYVSPKNMLADNWNNEMYVRYDGDNKIEITKPTMLWSKRDDLKGEKEYYDKLGFETRWFSTNNYEGCSLSPEFMDFSLQLRVSIVLHEDWHYNFGKWQPQRESNVNESAASFVGDVGAEDFIKKYYGDGSEEHKAAVRRLRTQHKKAEFLTKYYYLLKGVFDSSLSENEKSSLKENFLDQAEKEYYRPSLVEIWSQLPYIKNFVLIMDVYQSRGEDLGKMKTILRNLPGKESEAITYLRKFL
jgi:predicted aminopeptidase